MHVGVVIAKTTGARVPVALTAALLLAGRRSGGFRRGTPDPAGELTGSAGP